MLSRNIAGVTQAKMFQKYTAIVLYIYKLVQIYVIIVVTEHYLYFKSLNMTTDDVTDKAMY